MKIPNLNSEFLIRNSSSGQAVLATVIFFTVISLVITGGAYTLAYKESKISRDFLSSKKSYFTAEAGLEDMSYRLVSGKNYDSDEVMFLDGFYATTSVADTGGYKEVVSSADASSAVRRVKVKMQPGSGTSFHYGIQVGDGGLVMTNSSQVVGNVFSNGPVTGSNSNITRGDVIAAGPNGLVDGIHSTSSVYAHTIRNSQIDKDAYYQVISGTTIGGVSYPGSPDQATSSLPISDAQIEEFKVEAAAGGTHTSPCPYVLSGSVSLGPKKINCDLYVDGTDVLTLNGNVWVSGNINVSNNAIVKINPSLGDRTVVMIADKETNRSSSGQVYLSNTVQFSGSGGDKSYVLLVSQNNSAETGGGNAAITVSNSASGKVLLYAPHGMIYLSNNINVKEASAYKIQLANSASVVYETGLANLLFTSGPSGGYSIETWEEIE
ncbi:MAG: hypothetical protein L6Q29_02190 [Candidatus Pacebacteria bacterium]|nr:hypothetical protein [Candidatus Paceibacterota bacterium]NUQ56991.1 hypothetical protein [Candidatus Paceibacter sp.]